VGLIANQGRFAMTPIDAFLPHYDVHEVHAITIAGCPDAVYRAIRSLDFSRSPVIRGLFRMRGMPSAAIHLEGLLQSGFILLADHPGQCLVLGLVGRFWLPTGQLIPVAPEVFHVAEPAGCAKAAWDFVIEETRPGRVRLSTETRIRCMDTRSRKRFMLYWRLIGPFSAWIRREMLRGIKARVESEVSGR
jgi:hypothetical protein